MGDFHWWRLKDCGCFIDNVRAEWHKKTARGISPEKGIFWDCKFKTGNNLPGRKGISGVCSWCATFLSSALIFNTLIHTISPAFLLRNGTF